MTGTNQRRTVYGDARNAPFPSDVASSCRLQPVSALGHERCRHPWVLVLSRAHSIHSADNVLGCTILEDTFEDTTELEPLDPVPCPITLAWAREDRTFPYRCLWRSRPADDPLGHGSSCSMMSGTCRCSRWHPTAGRQDHPPRRRRQTGIRNSWRFGNEKRLGRFAWKAITSARYCGTMSQENVELARRGMRSAKEVRRTARRLLVRDTRESPLIDVPDVEMGRGQLEELTPALLGDVRGLVA